MSDPNLQTTLQNDVQVDNPNAIIMRKSSLNEIVPMLRSCNSVSPRTVSYRSTANNSPLYIKEMQDMDMQQFSETIKNLYLPFTLRKMYYKELMLRKPLFVGTSRKNIGFNGD